MPKAPTSNGVMPVLYATDDRPGITRVGSAGRFTYRWPGGRTVRDRKTLRRIQGIVIPPAWTDVWIAPDATGHVQATGRDARRRKQYRYHPQWRANRDAAKFDHLLEFAGVLPAIRAAVARDLTKLSGSRERVLAVVISLLERTHMRVGSEEYARTNNSYGLTTLKNGHARIRGGRMRFRFKGKSGVLHEVSLDDPKLARDVRRCQDLPGQTLFQYLDDAGEPRPIGSADVNRYLAEVSGTSVTAKDFRTWWGTVSAACILRHAVRPQTNADAKRIALSAIDRVAAELGNTRAVCRASYVHPAVLSAFGVGGFTAARVRTPKIAGLTADESWTVSFLQRANRRTTPAPKIAA